MDKRLFNDELYDSERLQLEEIIRSNGIDIVDLNDLMGPIPEAAIDPLLDSFRWIREPRFRRIVIRILTDPAARGRAAKPLLSELETAIQEGNAETGWVIGNALTIVAEPEDYDDILEFANMSEAGRARQMLFDTLARARFKSRARDALPVLAGALDDHEVAAHALAALRKLKLTVPRSSVEPLVTEGTYPIVRREAKKYLAFLDKQAQDQ